MCAVFNIGILKIDFLIFKILVITIVFCNFQYLEARGANTKQCLIGRININGQCVEPALLQDEPSSEGCANAGCSHGCLASAGQAFCTCPDDMELGEDWQTCQKSSEEVSEDEDNDEDVEENEEDNDDREGERSKNETEDDYEEEYEDEIDEDNKSSDKESEIKELSLDNNKLKENNDTDKHKSDENINERTSEEDKSKGEENIETKKHDLIEEKNSDVKVVKEDLEEVSEDNIINKHIKQHRRQHIKQDKQIEEDTDSYNGSISKEAPEDLTTVNKKVVHKIETEDVKNSDSGEHFEETGININKEYEVSDLDKDIASSGEDVKNEEHQEDNEDEDDEEDFEDEDENYDEAEEDENKINEHSEELTNDNATTENSVQESQIINMEENDIDFEKKIEDNKTETTTNNIINTILSLRESTNLTEESRSSTEENVTIQITTKVSNEEHSEEPPENEEYDENYDYYDKIDLNNGTYVEKNISETAVIGEATTVTDESKIGVKMIENEFKFDETAENVEKNASETTEKNDYKEITNNNVYSSNEDIEEGANTNLTVTVKEKDKNDDDEYSEEYEEEYEDEDVEEEDNEVIPKVATTLKPILTTVAPCEIGFEKYNNSFKCTDINECEIGDLNPCQHSCVNTIGHFYCICDKGFEISVEDNSSCLDIDKCQKDICSHGCINSLGGFECTCPENYYLQDINRTECAEINCTHGYDFNKSKNELTCVCPENYVLLSDNSTCIHKTSCANSNNCSQLCRNLNECFCHEGFLLLQDGYTCQEFSSFCQSGFALNIDTKSCEDIDECSNSDLNDCTQVCVNTIGSYECDCQLGFQLEDDEISCIDIDECYAGLDECDEECFNNIGSYICGCRQGFILAQNQRNCEDVDECQNDNGGCSNLCENLLGGHICSCPDHYKLQNDNRTCEIVDLCLENNGGCSHSCLNFEGTILCTCPDKFELDGKVCKKINPCEKNNGGCSHFCQLSNDFVDCTCPENYKLHNDTHCDKINPCFEFNDGCSHVCETINDTAVCKCPDDTYKLVHKTCHKINQCIFNNGGCSDSCAFLDDQIHCSCPRHHKLLEDNKTCQEDNPCRENNGNCSHECIVKDGIKVCLCPNGLELKLDQLTCQWIDACQINNGGCSHICDSISGQAICKCPLRFELVNKTCVRINPCLINNGGCSHFCHSTFRGRVKCSCPNENYILHGKICLENNICQKENGGCSQICSQEYGRKICKCENGFILRPDGFSCKEINECKIGNGGCSHGCTNTVGSYNCSCPKGLVLDDSKLICQDIDECQNTSPCDQMCTNYHGGFRCSCRQGFILAKDGRTCNTIGFSECPNFTLSNTEASNVRCLGVNIEGRKYVPVGTRCIVWCEKGYKLDGEAIHLCQNTGNWSSSSKPSCVKTACPKMVNPNAGRLIPSSCTSAKTFAGEKCRIYCKRGYRNVPGLEYIQCQNNLQWTTIGNQKRTIDSNQLSEACVQVNAPEPFILCPEQGKLSFELPKGQSKMVVQIPRPKSNVDWWRYIHSEPSWAKSLSTTLTSGQVEVKFTAYSPVSNETSASCQLVIDVKDTEPPTLTGCPEDILVQLNRGERQRNVYWHAPDVTDNVGVSNLYISKDSGSEFGIGKHYINYVASDNGGNRAYCHFNVIVKEPIEEFHSNKYRAVLVCPDGIHVAETSNPNDRNNIQVQDGCYWKHVRVTSPSHLTTVRPGNYFQRQYPDPYQLSHRNYPFRSNQIHSYRNNQQVNSYTPFSWYHRCC